MHTPEAASAVDSTLTQTSAAQTNQCCCGEQRNNVQSDDFLLGFLCCWGRRRTRARPCHLTWFFEGRLGPDLRIVRLSRRTA